MTARRSRFRNIDRICLCGVSERQHGAARVDYARGIVILPCKEFTPWVLKVNGVNAP